ncbi:MAG: class I SAM-dependent methyltransferase [Mycobacteriales bacterium]|nr:class I SAM-dependent methyltransferase [Mycobacteriales bacterium]
MRTVTHCLACGSDDLERTESVLAPFIKSYVGERHDAPGPDVTDPWLLRCRECGLSFFDRRYTDSETRVLYSEYRSAAYQAHRQRFEPLYTAALNARIGSDEAVIRRRRERVGEFLAAHLGSEVSTLLDFGGDAGQFLPDLPTAKKWVLELSDVQPVAGVTRVARLEDLPGPVDLLVLAHVLEHVTDPASLLDELGASVVPGGHLYVEVPLDRPGIPPEWAKPLHGRWVRFLNRGDKRIRTADLLSTPLRVAARGRWVPGTFPRLHEHLTYFTPHSLAVLLQRAGWTEVARLEYTHGGGFTDSLALGMLARRDGL